MPAERQLAFTSIGDQITRARSGEVTKWLIEGIIVEGGSTLLYAPPASAKSLISMDLAHAASTGGRWLGVYPVGDPRSVMWVDDDSNNDHEFNSRLLAFGIAPNPNWHCLLHNNWIITDTEDRQNLLRACQERDVRLVIIDSLTRIHRLSESNAHDMKIVNACIKEICLAGITVVMLHHTNKSGRTFRGSSEIPTAYDNVLSLEKVSGDRFALRNQKVRSISEGGIWEGCDIAVTTSEAGHLVLDGSLPPNDGRVVEADRMREDALALVREAGEMTQTAISKGLKLSSRRYPELEECLLGLVQEGTLDQEKRGRATIYTWMGNDEGDDEEVE